MLRCIYFAPIIQRVHGDGGEGKEKESEVTDIMDDSLCKVRTMRLSSGHMTFSQSNRSHDRLYISCNAQKSAHYLDNAHLA